MFVCWPNLSLLYLMNRLQLQSMKIKQVINSKWNWRFQLFEIVCCQNSYLWWPSNSTTVLLQFKILLLLKIFYFMHIYMQPGHRLDYSLKTFNSITSYLAGGDVSKYREWEYWHNTGPEEFWRTLGPSLLDTNHVDSS